MYFELVQTTFECVFCPENLIEPKWLTGRLIPKKYYLIQLLTCDWFDGTFNTQELANYLIHLLTCDLVTLFFELVQKTFECVFCPENLIEPKWLTGRLIPKK